MGEGLTRAEGANGDMRDLESQVLESLTSGVLVVDGHGTVRLVNRAARDHLRLETAHSLVGKPLAKVSDLMPLVAIYDEIKASGEGISRRELTLAGETGERLDLGMTASLLRGDEPFNGVIFLFIDLTEIRRLEREAEMNRQLASLGELTAGVVHELRSPLTIIRGRAEILLRKAEDEKTQSSLTAILEESKNLEKLVGQFLGFARPYELDRARHSVESLMDRVEALSRERAMAAGVTVQTSVGEGVPDLFVDGEKICRALSNVVNNGIDATGEGGTVALTFGTEEDHVVCEIEDDGPGISLAEGEDVFSPFFSRKRGGTGLGLSIVYKIITAHGGNVFHRDGEEGGTRFIIRLPIDV